MDTAPVQHVEIIDGKALIRRRYKAKLVAGMVVKAGATVEETMEQYGLSRAEVHAALAYYYDNQEAIERSFVEAETYAREVGISSSDLKAKMRAQQQDNQ